MIASGAKPASPGESSQHAHAMQERVVALAIWG